MKSDYSPKSSSVGWFGFLLIGFLSANSYGLDIYILRHAETMGNVTGDYSEQNQRTFSPKGLTQVAGVPERLKGLTFDAILVSPLWRTQQTILPYLKERGVQAELFPEIEESDCGINGTEAQVGLPPRSQAVEIIEEGTDCFTFPGDVAAGRYAPANTAEGLAIMREGVARMLERFGGTTQSVLLVTHSCTGGRVMELLLGLPPQGALCPANAVLSQLRQRPDGGFDLLTYNGEPLNALRRMLLFGFKAEDLPGFVDLSGAWRLTKGDDSSYAAVSLDDSAWKTTVVPGGWERDALPDYDGVAWYRLSFEVPADTLASWGTNPVAVVFGSVDDADETYLNAQRIGGMGRFSPEKVTAWDQPRIYEFNSDLLQTTNILAVRVDDWGGGGGIWRGPVAVGPAAVLKATAGE